MNEFKCYEIIAVIMCLTIYTFCKLNLAFRPKCRSFFKKKGDVKNIQRQLVGKEKKHRQARSEDWLKIQQY